MITRRTVFILGAGAHKPYGLLDGGDLMRTILSTLPASNSNNHFSEHLFNLVPTATMRDNLAQFRTAMDLGGHTSIDSFLATHAKRPGFTDIGMHAVAYELLPLEFRHEWIRRPHTGDWMSFLFESMLHGCLKSVDDFIEKNTVDFVTFNYDRTLEDFLCTRLAHTYNLSPEIAWNRARKFKIVHVYGSLGEFDPLVISSKRPAAMRGPRLPTSIANAAASIRFMYDDRTDHSGVSEAMELISSAPYLCFLGFGFDPDNITRLKLNECCRGKSAVYATRFNTRDGDWNRVVQNMAPVIFNQSTEAFNKYSIKWDALEFLHQTS